MSRFDRFKQTLRAAFLGASSSSGPALQPVAGTIVRPEGTRRYLLAAPGGAVSAPRPLLIILHGAGASAEQIMGQAFPPSPLSLLLEIGACEQFIVAAPDAGKGGWSDCRAGAAQVARKDDVGFIAALIDLALAEHGADPQRVYVAGVSRGGLMAYRVAAEIPHRLAAFAALLAPLPAPGFCLQPQAPLSALIIAATADPFMPFGGGRFWYTLDTVGPMRSIPATVRKWRELAGLPDEPQVTRIARRNPADRTRVIHYLWRAAESPIEIGLYRIERGGHAEPSLLKRYPSVINRLVGPQNGDFEAAQAVWDFCRDKRSA